MKRTLTGLVFSLFLFVCSYSQTTAPANSGDIIASAIKFHDQSKYKDAIKLLQQVPRNDTNYLHALYELAYSQKADSNLNESKKLCQEGLASIDDTYELDFLSLYASIIDDE